MVAIERATIMLWTAAGLAGASVVAAVRLTWQTSEISSAVRVQAVEMSALRSEMVLRMDHMAQDQRRLSDEVRDLRMDFGALMKERLGGSK